MSDILDELHRVVQTRGDTYSSMEVIGLIWRAETEIGRLRSMLFWIETYTDMVTLAEEKFGPVVARPPMADTHSRR